MWTPENRGRYDRSKLRYPSDLTEAEWGLVLPLIPPAKRGGNRRHVDVRQIVNALMYILSTGCQWRALPKDLPPRSTVHDYFDLWSWDGTLDRLHHALYVKCREEAGREASPSAAIIDSQSVKAAEKGGPRSTRLDMTRQEDQGEEAPYPGRHPGPAAARDRACRRHSGPRWRGAAGRHSVRHVSIPAEALCRWRLSRAGIPTGGGENPAPGQHRDRQALRPGQRLPRPAQTLDRRAHHRLAEPLPQAGQGLGKSQPQGACLPAPGINPPDVAKTMQPCMMFPDRL